MNRRRFLLSLPVLALLPRLLPAREPTFHPSTFLPGPDGTCTLSWDHGNPWRAEYAGRSRDDLHPRPWYGLDEEFFRMQTAAQNMAWGLVYEKGNP